VCGHLLAVGGHRAQLGVGTHQLGRLQQGLLFGVLVSVHMQNMPQQS
jgi:hypothetical protein